MLLIFWRNKMDIVEFVEKVYEIQLLDFQKEYIRKVYDTVKNNGQIIYIPPRGCQKFGLELLQAMAIIKIGQERG